MDATEAERIGREAVELGFDITQRGLKTWRIRGGGGGPNGWADKVPDFRDELTALACIPWLESVCREVYPHDVGIEHFSHVHHEPFHVKITKSGPDGVEELVIVTGPTLAHACIAAVRAAREAGK